MLQRLLQDPAQDVNPLIGCTLHHTKLKGENFQTPPDLVVKFQHLDIVDVILRRILRPQVVYQRGNKG